MINAKFEVLSGITLADAVIRPAEDVFPCKAGTAVLVDSCAEAEGEAAVDPWIAQPERASVKARWIVSIAQWNLLIGSLPSLDFHFCCHPPEKPCRLRVELDGHLVDYVAANR